MKGTMVTSSFFNSFCILFIFIGPLVGKASVFQRRFTYVEHNMTWREAQTYCRERHTDLATLPVLTDKLKLTCRHPRLCWIGLHKDSNDTWRWSNGEEPKNWYYLVLPGYPGKETCVSLGDKHYYFPSCNRKNAFLCHDDLMLVKEKKTWEEALEHCMALVDTESTSGWTEHESSYTLAHMDVGGGNPGAREAALDAETEEVWVGLRFLAGYWLWMNGRPLKEGLRICPQPGRYCGAMGKSGEVLPDKDCLERKNFLCMGRKKVTRK